MIIDLSEWNEYIADDVAPGPIPCGVQLETMQILTANSHRDVPKDNFPTGLQAQEKSIKYRLFWRIKGDN
jgi:hypothetical protein